MKKKVLFVICCTLLLSSLIGCSSSGKVKENNTEAEINEESNVDEEKDEERDKKVSEDFSYEHCSFWIDEEEEDIFTFVGTDRVKFYSVSNSGRYKVGNRVTSSKFNEHRGISVKVDEKYVVVVSDIDYRGAYWTTQEYDTNKYEVSNANDKEIYALSSGKYQFVKEIDGKDVYFYTSNNEFAKDISDTEERMEKIYEILEEASNSIVPYDNASFAIDKVVQDEFAQFNLNVNSYENITYYCPDVNANVNAEIQVDDYVFTVLFQEVSENQKFNHKMTDDMVGENSVGYYSSGSHTNLTIQNLVNDIYQNDYLIITAASIPETEDNTITEYAPELLNKVFQ